MQRTLPRRVVFARRLRRRPTVSEATLWHLLRRHQIDGFLFRRQFPVGPYFADFFCMQARFAIEIDGASHLGRSRRDRLRDTFFRRRGILVLRLPDTLVIKHPEHALILIRAAIHIWSPGLPRNERRDVDGGELPPRVARGAGGGEITRTPSPI